MHNVSSSSSWGTEISQFERYIGIDYSGAETSTSSLKGLRVYMATAHNAAVEVPPPPGPKKYWTRRGIAEWLTAILAEDVPTIVGIDHGFSFPIRYFETHRIEPVWRVFLEDFQEHWPTDGDHVYVDFVRDGSVGNGAARTGKNRWKRLTEQQARSAKSVFHFDVQGSVAKSTHSGLPWLLHLRRKLGAQVHFWPFDGWQPRESTSVIAEVYPTLWRHQFPLPSATGDQQDAFAVASWLRESDRNGLLTKCWHPQMLERERSVASIEGWILGVQ